MRLLIDRYTERLQADIARLTEERDAWHQLSQQYSAVIMDSVRAHDVLTQDRDRLQQRTVEQCDCIKRLADNLVEQEAAIYRLTQEHARLKAALQEAKAYSRNQMVEVLTALWDMQQSPDCWCDAGEGAPMHSPACAYARDVSRKYKALAYPESVDAVDPVEGSDRGLSTREKAS